MTEMEDGSALDCVACGGYVSIERLKQLPLCAGCEDREPCRCVMTDRGTDTSGCNHHGAQEDESW